MEKRKFWSSRTVQVIWHFICRHKYAVTIIIFVVVVGFVDSNSYYHRYQQQRQIEELRAEIEKYKQMYNRDTKLLKELDTNPRAMEKIARERYFMKKPNEDIYVIEKE